MLFFFFVCQLNLSDGKFYYPEAAVRFFVGIQNDGLSSLVFSPEKVVIVVGKPNIYIIAVDGYV